LRTLPCRRSASARITQMPFVGLLTLIGPACRNLREAAPGANRRACINIPGAKGTFVFAAKLCLSSEHSHRRHLLGSGRPWFPPREGIPRCHLRWYAPARLPLFKVRRPAVIYRRRFRYRRWGKAGSKPVAIIATVDRGSLICGGSHRAVPKSRSPRSTERVFDQRVGLDGLALDRQNCDQERLQKSRLSPISGVRAYSSGAYSGEPTPQKALGAQLKPLGR
jgi:hypothetical protein